MKRVIARVTGRRQAINMASSTDEDSLGSRSVESTPQEGPQAGRHSYPVKARSALTSEGLPRSCGYRAELLLRRCGEWGAAAAPPAGHRVVPERHWTSPSGVIVPRFGSRPCAQSPAAAAEGDRPRQVLPGLTSLDVVLRSRPEAYQAEFSQLSQDLERGDTRCRDYSYSSGNGAGLIRLYQLIASPFPSSCPLHAELLHIYAGSGPRYGAMKGVGLGSSAWLVATRSAVAAWIPVP